MGTDAADAAFGDAVRATRTARGMSRELLAERSGLSVEHVGRVERGSRSLSLRAACALAAALDVPLADLLTET